MNAPAQPPPPPTPDTKAAHEFLTELTTRIATQRLPYRDGDEQTALESLASLFPKGRAIIHANPGCTTAKAEIEAILNNVLRPFTAKWHRQSIEGCLAGRDGADAFREELLDVQDKARESAAKLAGIAAGDPDRPVNLPWPSEEPSDLAKRLDEDMEPLRCGIPEQMAGLPDLLAQGEPTQKKAPYGTAAPRAINQAEAHAIRDRRKNVGASRPVDEGQPPYDAFGLAFSGGGIRSASFALGVAQALGEKGLLKEADYVSTVSGGGYTGSFITRRLGAVKPQTSPADPSRGVIDKPNGPDTPAISYLRMRAGYLSGDGFKRRWLMACHMISGTLLNWMAPLFLLLLPAFVLSVLVVLFDFEFNVQPDSSKANASGTSLLDWAKHWWATTPMVEKVRECNRVLILGFALAGTLIYGVRLRFCASSKKALSGVVQGTGVLFGLSVSFGLAYLLLDVLDGHALDDAKDAPLLAGDTWLKSLWDKAHAVAGSAAGAGTLGVVAHALGNAKVRKALVILGMGLAVLVVPFTALVMERSMLELAVQPRADANPKGDGSPSTDNKPHGNPWIPIGATVVVFVGVLVALDVNRTSPRPLYQERLARTFIKFKEDDDEIPLETANPSGLAPIHILNSALNLPGTTAATMRERGCDFFSFTPFYCGAPTIGYEKTSEWKSHGKTVSLDVAMAVSAAASSRMGLFAVPGAAPLMTLLNVRLGYWLRKPWQPGSIKVPGAMQLTSEMTGWRMDERAEWINLSDGGHIENMAAYELLRRRCKFILCVDGEADGDFGFGGLMTLVRHARIDMGIDMQPMLNELRPKEKGGPSRSHFAMWKIHYPNPAGPEPGPVGFFLYLKLSMTGNEPELIRTYQQKHPDFPHQSTADQFFNQEQFEAYRSLGAHVTEMLFKPALLRAPGEKGGAPKVQDVSDLFRRIARNMLY